MDILEWILGSYMEEIVEKGKNPIHKARHVHPEEVAMKASVGELEPLVQLHPGMSY